MKIAVYHTSKTKILLNILFALFSLLILSPILILISFLQKVLYPTMPIFFVQKRTGLNGRTFNMFKFRTMIRNAHRLQNKYKYLNISDGPAFKIWHDPRYTKFGKVLAKLGLDETPQFLNILKGEMAIVGPRPLPIAEAKKIKKQWQARQLVLPGITSPWVVEGGHLLKFSDWMKLDMEYVKKATLTKDLEIIIRTFLLGVKSFLYKILD